MNPEAHPPPWSCKERKRNLSNCSMAGSQDFLDSTIPVFTNNPSCPIIGSQVVFSQARRIIKTIKSNC